MSDARVGPCLCCNVQVTFSAKAWAEKSHPSLFCQSCAKLVSLGMISAREVRMLYIIRSQIGWLFERVKIMEANMAALCSSQEEIQRAYFENSG